MQIATFKEAESFLFSTVPKTKAAAFKGTAGLDKSRRFFAALNNPQNARPALHIAATSGKGTTAHMIEAILRAHDKTVVTITSPHVYSVTERVRLNGAQLGEEAFVSTLNQLLPVYEQFVENDEPPSYFEMNVAIGFMIAQQEEVDYVVVETGLGGLLDTTNTIRSEKKINILGQIGFDHTSILGSTLPEIAAHKAGIITGPQATTALQQKQEVNAVFSKHAEEAGSRLTWVQPDIARQALPRLVEVNHRLAGEHQYANLALAIAAAQEVAKRDAWTFKPKLLTQAMREVRLPGRLESLDFKGHEVIFDGAHNIQKLAATIDAVKDAYNGEQFAAVLASTQRGDAEAMADYLQQNAQTLLLTSYHSQELDMFRPAYDFSAYAEQQKTVFHEDHTKIAEIIANSTTRLWLVTGSFYMLSSVRQALDTTR